MLFRSLYLIIFFTLVGCTSSKLTFEEIRDRQPEFIEINIGSAIYGPNSSRLFLSKDGTLVTEKRSRFGSSRLTSNRINSDLTDSVFTSIAISGFESMPQNIDQNCYVSFKDNRFSGTMTDQPTKSIIYKNPSQFINVIWKECRAFTDLELELKFSAVTTEEEFEQINRENNMNLQNVEKLNSLLRTVLSLGK